jgi:hypothetical protein
MPVEAAISSHINNLRSIIKHLAKFKETVDEEDPKAILLNSFLLKYNSDIFTMSELPSRSLDEMIAALL